MTDLASPIVQVVSGTDWAAIAAAISGGVVGLAGIIFASRQSGKTISAEDARIRLADKRRTYAAFQTSLDRVFAIAAPTTQRATVDMLSDLDAALPAMYNSASELRLIAPPEVGNQARRVAITLAAQAEAAIRNQQVVDPNNMVYSMREQLYKLMRADLGEPESGRELLSRATQSGLAE
jgi:phage I-like protein